MKEKGWNKTEDERVLEGYITLLTTPTSMIGTYYVTENMQIRVYTSQPYDI